MFARKYNNNSNLFTHAQIRPTWFLKFFLTASWSGGTLPQKVCGSFAFSSVWKPRKFKSPGWLYKQFRRSHHEPPLSLTNSLKMYHVSILIVKRARNLKTIPASWPTDVAILLNWLTTFGIKVVSRIYDFIVKRHDIFHNSNVFKVCEYALEHI